MSSSTVQESKEDTASVQDSSKFAVSQSAISVPITRAQIEAESQHIMLCDTDEETGVELFCQSRQSTADNEITRNSRGIVFKGDTIVMLPFPHTPEFLASDVGSITSYLKKVEAPIHARIAHEGTLIRVFHSGGKWFVSTHRRLNAYRSKWSSRVSFGEMFDSALSHLYETDADFSALVGKAENESTIFTQLCDKVLKTDRQYMFLVLHLNDNRIVCEAPKVPTLFHVGTFIDGKLDDSDSIGIPHPLKLEFQTVEELCAHVKGMHFAHHKGLLITESGSECIIVNEKYHEYFNIRGNEMSIKFRYLQLRNNKRQTALLFDLYPDMIPEFQEIENTLNDIVQKIYTAYVDRFIRKKFVTLPKEEYRIMSECHSWHLSDRSNNLISGLRVWKVMNQQNPSHLNHMIRRVRAEKAKQADQKASLLKVQQSGIPNVTPVATEVGTPPVPSPLVLPYVSMSVPVSLEV